MAQLVIVVGTQSNPQNKAQNGYPYDTMNGNPYADLTKVAKKAYIDTLRKKMAEQDFVEQMKIALHDINYKYSMMWLDVEERKDMMSADDYQLLYDATHDAYEHEVEEWANQCTKHGLSEDMIKDIIFRRTREEE